MKKLSLSIFLSGAVFIFGFFLGKYPQFSNLLPKEKENGRFQAASYTLKERPFAILIIGKNSGPAIQRTIQSALCQAYENYRIIYLDDASTDGSFELARDLILDSSKIGSVTFLQNRESIGYLENLERAVESLSDEEIAVILKPEDALAHEWVLEKLNKYYQDLDLWLTVGEYVEYPSFARGENFSIEKLREKPDLFLHLMTFYAGLFKKIENKGSLLKENGAVEKVDAAYMIPMIEMAKGHVGKVADVLYLLYNKKEEGGAVALYDIPFSRPLASPPYPSAFEVP